MRKILVANGKGGCGKTTVAVNLAVARARRGRAVSLVDADPQGSASIWAGMRPPDLAPVVVRAARGLQLDRLEAAGCELAIIDTAAGTLPAALQRRWLDAVDAVVVPVLPSGIDLDATLPWLQQLAQTPRVAAGKLPVAIVVNRLRAWTRTGQDAVAEMGDDFPFPVVAQLRDSQAYVLLAGLGKSLFDYHSASIRSHQDDWLPLLRWLQRHTRA